MMRLTSCGLLLACALVSAGPVTAQELGPPTFELTMERALALARTNSPLVRVARAQIEVDNGRAVGASVSHNQNPTISLGGGPRIRERGTSPDLDVGVDQVFELGGQRDARVEAAEAEVEQRTALAVDTARRTLREVATAFLRARYAEERVRIAADTEELASEIHRVALRRHEAGDVGILDVNLAALAQTQAHAVFQQAEASRGQAFGELRMLLGLEPDVILVLHGALLDRRHYRLEELLARVAERPDLVALEAAIRQADAELRLGEAEEWPDLGLGLSYAREEEADLFLATLTLTLPFFDHGQGTRAEALAQGETIRIEREHAGVALRTQVQTAFDAYERLVSATEGIETNGLPLIEQSVDLASRSYESGAIQLGDLLAIRRELVAARSTYVDLLLRTALAGVELEAEAGILQ